MPDVMVEYTPKFLDLLPVTPYQQVLPRAQAKLLETVNQYGGILELRNFFKLVEDAQHQAQQVYPSPPSGCTPQSIAARDHEKWATTGDHQAAFRHAYLSARLTQEYGQEWAKQYATAQESSGQLDSYCRTAMNLYNIEVGRQIAHPFASTEQLTLLIHKAIMQNQLLVIDARGELAWSNQVLLNEHGLASVGPAMSPCIPHPPEGNAPVHKRHH